MPKVKAQHRALPHAQVPAALETLQCSAFSRVARDSGSPYAVGVVLRESVDHRSRNFTNALSPGVWSTAYPVLNGSERTSTSR